MNKIILIALAGGLAILLIYLISFYTAKKNRIDRLKMYRDFLKSSLGHPDARSFYEDSMHLMLHYGVLPADVGWKDFDEVHTAAVRALNLSIERISGYYMEALSKKDDEAVDGFNDDLVYLRAELAKLMLLPADETMKAKAANTFVTLR